MSGKARRRELSPSRVLVPAFGLGLGAVALAAIWPEWLHLWRALTMPFHAGAPPSWAALAAGALVVFGGSLWAIALARRRRLPRWPLALLVLAALAAYASTFTSMPGGRNPAAANLEILKAARALQLELGPSLQASGRNPPADQWRAAVDRLNARGEGAPVRTRLFRRVPFVLALGEVDGPFSALRPGTLWVQAPAEGAAFAIAPVGFAADWTAAPLTGEKGDRLVLRSAYNP